MAAHTTHGACWAPSADPDSHASSLRSRVGFWRALLGMVGGCSAAGHVARSHHGGTHLEPIVQVTDGRLANLGFVRRTQQGGFAR